MWPFVGPLRTTRTCNGPWLNSLQRFSLMPCTMSLTVPTALRATYDQLATMSSAVARRYVEVATVVQPAFTPTEFAIWTRHCLQLAQSGWRAWESVDAFLQLSPFLQQRLVVDDLWTWAEHGVALARLLGGGGERVLSRCETASPGSLRTPCLPPGRPVAAPISNRRR